MIELIATNDSRAMRNKNNVLYRMDAEGKAICNSWARVKTLLHDRAEHSACECQRHVLTAKRARPSNFGCHG
jgi:hypothetical protein